MHDVVHDVGNIRKQTEDQYFLKKKRNFEFTHKQKQKILQRQNYKCNNFPGSPFELKFNYCCLLHQNGGDGTFEQKVGHEIDHIIPIQERGTNEIENGQALCVCCHRVKTKYENKNYT